MAKAWSELTIFLVGLGVIAIAVLGSVARLYHDHPEEKDAITRRDVVRYTSAGLLAGIVMSLIVYWRQGGVDPLLFGISGLGGFGAVQILGLAVELVTSAIRRLGYDAINKYASRTKNGEYANRKTEGEEENNKK